MGRGYTPSQRDLDIIEMFNNGEIKATNVAKHFKISRERVRQILAKNGIEAGANRNNECKRNEQLVRGVMKTHPLLTATEQSKIIGLNASTILSYRKKLKLKHSRTPDFLLARRKARFWTRINITADPDECWNWTGYVNKQVGYPHSSQMIGTSQRAQVIVWQLTRGAPQHNISTTCDNPLCCNPSHLEDVKLDKLMEKRKRTYLREPHRRADMGKTRKYDDNTVKYLKDLKKTMTYSELHRATKVPLSTLYNLIKRRSDG